MRRLLVLLVMPVSLFSAPTPAQAERNPNPPCKVAKKKDGRRAWTLCATFPAGDPVGTAVLISPDGWPVSGTVPAGRSICDDDNNDGVCSGSGDRAGRGSDDVTPLGVVWFECAVERTADGTSCKGWPASPDLMYAVKFNRSVMMVHRYKRAGESHGCIRVIKKNGEDVAAMFFTLFMSGELVAARIAETS